jgi:hypothetical protein
MKISDIEDIDKLAGKDDLRILSAELRAEAAVFRAEMQKAFGDFRAEIQKQFGDFRTDITKTLWVSQLSMAGIIVALVGLINGGTFFLISQMIARIPHTP